MPRTDAQPGTQLAERPRLGKDAPTKLLISARQAAADLSICEKTLWSMTAPRGPIPVVKIGRRRLYDPNDLARFIEERKVKGDSPDEKTPM